MKNILIVEDNPIHADALEVILSDIDKVRVFKAYNMAEACYMLSLRVYQLVIVDLVLDTGVAYDLSGIKFIEMLRDSKRYEFAPIIVITSLEDPKLVAYKELHCYDYIEKPYDSSEVIKVVKKVIDFPAPKDDKRICYFKKGGVMYSVVCSEITYVQVSRKEVCIYTTRDELKLPYRSVDSILEELGHENFVRCSRGVIVSRDYIQYVDFNNRYLKIIGVDEPVEISSTMKRQLREALVKEV